MRIVFMGTPEFAVPSLERLIQSQYQVVAVYTQPGRGAGRGRGLKFSPVEKIALAQGLPLVQPRSLKLPEEMERLASFHPDVVIVAAFGQLLPQGVLDLPPLGCINVHPSLLPQHRGPSPVSAAILAGDEITGVTIMLMDAGLDTGPVIAQVQGPISADDTRGSLSAKLAQSGAELLEATLPLWLHHRLTPQPQDEGKATFSRLISKGEGEIDWRLSAIEICRRVRAFQPWPGCYTRWRGQQLKVIEAVPLEGVLEPGRVISLEAGVGVGASSGVVELRRVQIEGRKALPMAEFLRGQRDFLGALLTLP